MSRFIRIKGLAAFVVIAGLGVASWLLFVDGWVRYAIERAGSRAVGAKVELEGADLSLFPAGLTLTGLAVTDPDHPMTNQVEVARAALTIDGGKLLLRKLIVEEMAVEGVVLNTPRSRSGALKKAPPPPPKPEKDGDGLLPDIDLPTMDLPDMEQVLADAKLGTTAQADKLKADVAALEDQWKKRLAALPGEADLKRYRQRIKALKNPGTNLAAILAAGKEIKTIQRDIDRDVKAVRKARTDFNREVGGMGKRLQAVRGAPAAEAKRLASRYGFGSVGEIAATLFGNKARGWVEKGNGWYTRVQPMITRVKESRGQARVVKPLRGKGVDVLFAERAPLPDFLIKRAAIDVALEAGHLAGTVVDATPDPDVLGRPMTFKFSGDDLEGLGRIDLAGTFDHVRADAVEDSVVFSVTGYRAKDMELVGGGALPLTLAKGVVDLSIDARVTGPGTAAEALAATIDVGLSGASLVVGEGAKASTAKIAAPALAGVKKVGIGAQVTGTLARPKIKISSDLDTVLRDAVTAAGKAQVAALEKELKAEISARLNERLKGVQGEIAGVQQQIGKQLTARSGDLERVLKDALR